MKRESPSLSRRTVIGAAVAAGTGAALGMFGSAFAEEPSNESADGSWTGLWGEQMGFWVDTSKCVDCGTCAHACRRANDTPEDQACRRKILVVPSTEKGTTFVSVSCMHCLNPSCMAVCPAGAISKRESDGAVVVDRDVCIGCRYCYQACPFEVPKYDDGGMTKCDMCISNGRYPDADPACVARCPHGALHFGKIQDLIEEVGDEALAVTGITGPSLIIS